MQRSKRQKQWMLLTQKRSPGQILFYEYYTTVFNKKNMTNSLFFANSLKLTNTLGCSITSPSQLLLMMDIVSQGSVSEIVRYKTLQFALTDLNMLLIDKLLLVSHSQLLRTLRRLGRFNIIPMHCSFWVSEINLHSDLFSSQHPLFQCPFFALFLAPLNQFNSFLSFCLKSEVI